MGDPQAGAARSGRAERPGREPGAWTLRQAVAALPCRTHPELFFAEDPQAGAGPTLTRRQPAAVARRRRADGPPPEAAPCQDQVWRVTGTSRRSMR
ncbi:MAG: hypothetical protein ACLQER_08700, partial [Streptosporangiaceae bacterium]